MLVTLYRMVLVSLLIGFRVFDPKMFTYIDYTLVSLAYLLFLYSARTVWLYQLFTLYVLPVIIGTTLSVTVSIVVILQSNGGSLLIGASTLNGGSHSLGTVHTVHTLVHFFTSVDMLLMLLFNWDFIKANYRATYMAMGNTARIAHAIWFIVGALVVLTVYMMNFNFVSNYPVHMLPWQSVLLQIVVSILIGFVFWLRLVVGEHDERKAGYTPIHKWLRYL